MKNPPERIHAYNVGTGTIRTIAFASLDATIVLMTSPELETTYIKRSKLPVHYVYLPHNMTSTHMVFRAKAFNGFDTIFCTGLHQFKEHMEAQRIYSLRSRNLLKGGYVKLDSALEVAAESNLESGDNNRRVVLAPTWGPDALINFGCAELVQNLLDHEIIVIMRPHRISEIEDRKKILNLEKRFGNHKNFLWAKDLSGDKKYYDADVLITDWSGSAFSFAFGFERPVLFVDLPQKIKNNDYDKFSNVPLEVSIRSEMGKILALDRLNEVSEMVFQLCEDKMSWAEKIKRLRKKWCYKVGEAAPYAAKNICQLLEELNSQNTS